MHSRGKNRRAALAGLAAVATLTAGIAVAGPADAAAAPPPVMTAMLAGGGTVSGPFPYSAPPSTEPAGEVCSYALTLTPTTNQTFYYRYTDASGFDAAEYYYGPLIVTAKNDTSGATERLNLSGSGLYLYSRDGSATIYGAGPYGFGLHAGDTAPGHPGPFYAVPDGLSKDQISATGQRTIRYATGGVRDVCQELA